LEVSTKSAFPASPAPATPASIKTEMASEDLKKTPTEA